MPDRLEYGFFPSQRSLSTDKRSRKLQPQPIDVLIDRLLESHGLRRDAAWCAAFDAWEQVIEPSFAPHTKPVRFEKGELLVEVTSSVHFHELENFHRESLRWRLNRELGKDDVKRLCFKHGS